MKRAALCIILLGIPVLSGADGRVRLFQTVHFKGLKTLSKYDIAKSAGMASKDGRIVVDMKRLEAVLSGESVIRDYKLIDKKNILTIIVSEYSPEYVFLVVGRRTNIFCEVDSTFRIISRGVLHTDTVPVHVVNSSAVDGNRIADEYKEHITEVLRLAGESAVGKQMKQIDYTTSGRIKITLFGRRTVFVLSALNPEFDRLEIAAGYCDMLHRYPSTLDVRGRIAVIR
ncbi:MAG: hypothetical protein ACOCWH_02850 [Spirochaetota bacterium]